MNILITGAGLIGSHCARQAVDAGNKVVLFDLSPNRDYLQKVVGKDRADVVAADMRDLPALISAMERHNVDTVVHTAGLIGSRVAENSYTGATNNILGTINVLEASRLRRLRRVVYVSTFGVYDRAKINDSVVRETHPIGGHNLYTVTKICSEHLVHSYAEQYKLDCIIIRPSGVFGENLRSKRICLRQRRGPRALPRLPSAEPQAASLQRRQRRGHRSGDAGTNCSRIGAADGSQGNECKRHSQRQKRPTRSQYLKSRARLHTAVSAKRGLAKLHGRVVGRTKELGFQSANRNRII